MSIEQALKISAHCLAWVVVCILAATFMGAVNVALKPINPEPECVVIVKDQFGHQHEITGETI